MFCWVGEVEGGGQAGRNWDTVSLDQVSNSWFTEIVGYAGGRYLQWKGNVWAGENTAIVVVGYKVSDEFADGCLVVFSTGNVEGSDKLLFSFDLAGINVGEDLNCRDVGEGQDGTGFNESGIVTNCVLEGLEVSNDSFSLSDSLLNVFNCTLC